MLRGRSFAIPLGAADRDGARAWTLWGAGDGQRFEGVSTAGSYEGALTSAWAGFDARLSGNWLAGTALSRSWGEADYDARALGGSEGRVQTTLDAVYPYLRGDLFGGVEVWAIAGYGRGTARDRWTGGAADDESGLEMRMGAAGLRRELNEGPRLRFSLVSGGGYLLLTTPDGARAVDGVEAAVAQGRVALEASRSFGPVAPYVQMGGRFDRGAGQPGAGLELVAGVDHAGDRLGVELRGRWLAVHSGQEYREYGGSARVAVRARADGSGLRLDMAPAWGSEGDRGMLLGAGRELLGAPGIPGMVAGGMGGLGGGRMGGVNPDFSLRSELGYGVRLGPGIVTPGLRYDRLGALGGRKLLGVAFEPRREGPAVLRSLRFGFGWEPAAAGRAPDYRLELRYFPGGAAGFGRPGQRSSARP